MDVCRRSRPRRGSAPCHDCWPGRLRTPRKAAIPDSEPAGSYDDPGAASARRTVPARIRLDLRTARAAELLLQQSASDRADARRGDDPHRDGPRRPHRPHERAASAEDDPQVDGRFDRPLGRRHAGGRHHEFQRQDSVPRLDRKPARRRALHARGRATRCSIASRSTTRTRGRGRGPASTRGRRPTSGCTNTRATKPTTRWETFCAARVCEKQMRQRRSEQR